MSRWNFRRSFRLLPGIRLNLGSRSFGVSLGAKGAKLGVNSKRGAYSHLSIPGTGLYSRTYFGNANSTGVQKNAGAARGGIRGIFETLRSYINPVRYPDSSALIDTPPEDPPETALKSSITSAFLYDHLSDLEGCTDADGDLKITQSSPKWICDLYDDAMALGPSLVGPRNDWTVDFAGRRHRVNEDGMWIQVRTPLMTLMSNIYRAKKSYEQVKAGSFFDDHIGIGGLRYTLGPWNEGQFGVVILPDGKPIKAAPFFVEELEPESNPDTGEASDTYTYRYFATIEYAVARESIHKTFDVILLADADEYRFRFENGVR